MAYRMISITAMKPDTHEPLTGELAVYDTLVEVGIGCRVDVARTLLARGSRVTATDIYPRTVPEGVEFALDDVTDPDISIYDGCGVVYARNLPPELHRPARNLARHVDADFLFTTLGGDGPEVPVSRKTLPNETMFVAER
jgi:uncharacterized UPF0146 family protein